MNDIRRGRVVTEEYLQYVDSIVNQDNSLEDLVSEVICGNPTDVAAKIIIQSMRRLAELERPQNPLGRTATFEQNVNRAIDETCEKHFG